MSAAMSPMCQTLYRNPAKALSKIAGFCLALSFPWAVPAAFSDRIEKFDAKPVHVKDRFENDTRKDYRIAGNVTWSTLKLTIPKDGAIGWVKTIDADFQFECDLWPKEMKDGEQNVSKLNLPITNGYELVIVISRLRKGNQVFRQAAVVELRASDPKSPPKVDQLQQTPAFSLSGDVERWSLHYKNGVIELRCGGPREFSKTIAAGITCRVQGHGGD
jgi:hypothetical protein